MKIVFVTDTMTKGGAERVIANLSAYLSKNNEVFIITLFDSEIAYPLPDSVKVLPLDDFKTNIYNVEKKNIFFRLNNKIKRIKKMKQYKKEIKPDVMVAFMLDPSFLTLFVNRFHKDKTIISVRNDPNMEFAGFRNNFLMKWLFPKTNGIVFQTEDAKNYFSRKIGNKGIVIPNPINPEFINDRYTGDRKKEIVSVARLTKQKNQKLLINAFSNVVKKHPDYKLIIYGEGDLREELESLIDEKGLTNKVLLPGKVDNVKEKIKDAGMFILSSDYEGMPNALMEAMALGLPVISTDCPCGGSKFLIKNNINGILIEVNNQQELEKAMDKVIIDKDFSSSISNNAYKICEELNPDKINKKWQEYISKINGGD